MMSKNGLNELGIKDPKVGDKISLIMKLSITLDTFPTRIMKRSVRRQPLRRIFAALQQGEAHQWTSRSCGCSSNSWYRALRKNLCKFKNCDKSDILERLKNNRSNFFTVYNGYCNLSRFFGYQPAGMESGWYPAAQPSLSGYMISSSPRTLPQFRSGIVHFLAISCVARYRAFRSAVSLGNTLLCLFRRR